MSVVTPVYNTGEFIEQAIRSVLEQTYGNFEYIVCNNHSTDATGEIAERYQHSILKSASYSPRVSCRRRKTSILRCSRSRRKAVTPK